MKRAIITTLFVFLLGGIGAISIRSLLRNKAPKIAQAKPGTQPIPIKTNTATAVMAGWNQAFKQILTDLLSELKTALPRET